MIKIRFFTSLMLRPGEEVDASIVPWLTRWATVEFEGEEPVTGVWQTSDGDRRVCWYGGGTAADYRDAHNERHGEEPFWIVLRELDAAGNLGATVQECDARGEVVARRVWKFDIKGIPAVPELSGETFPCGGTMSDGLVRVLCPVFENDLQGRYRSVCWRDDGWRPAITTLAFVWSKGIDKARPILEYEGEDVAPLVAKGHLHHPRWPAWETLFGITELVPDGSTVEEMVESAPTVVADAVRIALRVGEVARRAQERGHDLGGGIRPELIYLRPAVTGLELSGLLHRAPAVLAATRRGEAILFPPNTFPCDFSHHDDVTGLAQLLWFMVTGGHPFLAKEDIRWDRSWNGFRHENRRRRPWAGPSALRPLLEGTLFPEESEPPSLGDFLAELGRVHEGLTVSAEDGRYFARAERSDR